MEDILTLLYDCFYTPPQFKNQKELAAGYHRQLIDRLEKPERKLVLRLIDTHTSIQELVSIDSFLCGFKLALELSSALKQYDGHLYGDCADGDVRHLLSEESQED